MLMQFSTGSIEDRETEEIGIDVHNAGIQASNITCTLIMNLGDRKDVITKKVKVGPRSEMVVMRAEPRGTESPELILEVDSPSLIIMLKVETRFPLRFKVVATIDRPEPQGGDSPTEVTLLSGIINRGDPF